ncbi:MAG: iron ABC transporter permease [Armatimonadetes bacterium]|nr:iron ABC transporter permease [Armatimonadota bacterium]
MRTIRRMAADPGQTAAFAAVGALLLLFVLYPSFRVLITPGLRDYLAIPANARWLQAARNSLVMMVLSTATATGVGFLYAFAISRQDLPLRRLFQTLSVLPLFAPPFMVAFSYILMFGRQGMITRGLLGLDVNIYGWPGLWLVQTVAFFPFAALIIGAVLDQITPTLEHAARNLGAHESAVIRTILFPLARPGVAAAMLVVAISVLADFGNAVVIAGGYPLLATEAWFRIEGLADLNGAAVVVAILIVPTIGLFLLERFWVSRRAYTTVAGKGSPIARPATPPLIKWSLFGVCVLVSILVGLVYVGVIAGSVATTWGYNWTPTLHHWRLGIAQGGAQLLNSLKVGAWSALVTSAVAVVAAFITSRRDLPLLKIVDFLAVLPAALPGVFIGVGYLLAFNAPPLILAGTEWILVLALAFWHIPMGYQAAVAQLKQIDKSIEEAAQNLGAPGLRVLWDVYVPLLRPAFTASFITAFIRAVTNLSIVVFLVTPRNLVATYSILSMIGGGFWGAAAALTTALLAITLAGVAVARLLLGRGLRPMATA